MSFIEFQSATEKEKIRQELRAVREKLLEKAEFNAKRRDENAAHRKVNEWMLPSVSDKIDKSDGKSKSKKSKKKQHKKEKKLKKKKSKKHKRHSSSEDESSDSVEMVPKKSRKRRSSSSSSSGSSSNEDEWVEKKSSASDSGKPLVRDDWMSSGFLLPTYSKEQKDPATSAEKSNYQEYDPSKSVRELNPHWKEGGSGLPSTFMKPSDDFSSKSSSSSTFKRQNWKKIPETKTSRQKTPSESESSSTDSEDQDDRKPSETPPTARKAETTDFLTDAQMNDLGAKMIKAEIMGNTKLAEELKLKLEKAKACRENVKDQVKSQRSQPQRQEKQEAEEVVLTSTDSRGITRPVSFREDSDLWGGRRGGKKKRPKVETHTAGGERTRFFPDDDHRTLQEMFQAEKMVSASDSDAQFARAAGRKRRQGDDLEDIFAEEVRKDLGDEEKSSRDRDRAIREHEQLTKTLDSCEMCFDSPKMAKELIVAMGSKVYLSLPWHEALQTGHCIISPIQHVSCSTQLDEEVWREVQDFQTALIRMFSDQKKDCVFYEIANKLHRRPHLTIHCIPSSGFELAPFYFKKAIQESEAEWSTNRQLIDLKKEGKSVRRAIPRGLPYFWVSFTDHAGFAHVIEDQERFPSNFALEILGGLLNLDARRWRKPRREHNIVQKVKQFADSWKKFDITN